MHQRNQDPGCKYGCKNMSANSTHPIWASHNSVGRRWQEVWSLWTSDSLGLGGLFDRDCGHFSHWLPRLLKPQGLPSRRQPCKGTLWTHTSIGQLTSQASLLSRLTKTAWCVHFTILLVVSSPTGTDHKFCGQAAHQVVT